MSDNDGLPDMDAMAIGVATVTGLKKQLTDSGWSELSAEQMVIAMITRS